jgi:GT2 family glycosyltransferase
MSNSTSFSLVICAYSNERWDDLCLAIMSVRNQTHPPQEIIAVIDHNPALLDKVCAEFPEIRITANHYSQGLSGSRNTGVEIARGDLIAFMDDDATASPDWLQQLEACYTSSEIIGVGGSILPQWDAGRPAWFPAEFDWVVGCTYQGMPRQTSQVRNLIGCNMSFRREAFDIAGGFHTQIGRIGKLPLGCEETEFCIRLSQLLPMSRLIFEPNAIVRHRVTSERGMWRYYVKRCYSEGISKVLVSREVGASNALASEKAYTFRTLPRGVLKGIADTCLSLDLAGIARAGAIILGLVITTTGYLSALLTGPEHKVRAGHQDHSL